MLDSDGNTIFVAGYWYAHPNAHPYFALGAYDAATGKEFWTVRVELGSSNAVRIDPDGERIYVTGGRSSRGRGFLTVAYWMTLVVDIDIRPDTHPNLIDPEVPGVVQVAILGSEGLDVSRIDLETVRFGPARAAPAAQALDPLAGEAPDATGFWYVPPDVNRDGFADLLVTFQVQETGIRCGDTEATLTGELLGGRPFEGTDSIETNCR